MITHINNLVNYYKTQLTKIKITYMQYTITNSLCWDFQNSNSTFECALVHFLPLVQSLFEHFSIVPSGGFRTRKRAEFEKSYTALTLPANWCSYGLKQCNHNNRHARLYSMKQVAHICPTRQSILSLKFKLQSKNYVTIPLKEI